MFFNTCFYSSMGKLVELKIPKLFKNRKTMIIILFFFVLALALPSYLSYEYIENDPTFCISCHLMQEPFDLWKASAMHSVTCHNCHQQSVMDSMNLLYQTVLFNPKNVTKHANVPITNCEKCHVIGDASIRKITDEIGHVVHRENANISCLDCHSKTLHQFTPSSAICADCHEEQLKTPGMQIHCTSCHQYKLKDKESLLPARAECVSCHVSKQEVTMAVPVGAHLKTECSNCHKPHNQSMPISCASCHEDVLKSSVREDVLPNNHSDPAHLQLSCQECHIPHTSEAVRTICTDCHRDKITHNSPDQCNECHNFKKLS